LLERYTPSTTAIKEYPTKASIITTVRAKFMDGVISPNPKVVIVTTLKYQNSK
jgi:hypothetical protein